MGCVEMDCRDAAEAIDAGVSSREKEASIGPKGRQECFSPRSLTKVKSIPQSVLTRSSRRRPARAPALGIGRLPRARCASPLEREVDAESQPRVVTEPVAGAQLELERERQGGV